MKNVRRRFPSDSVWCGDLDFQPIREPPSPIFHPLLDQRRKDWLVQCEYGFLLLAQIAIPRPSIGHRSKFPTVWKGNQYGAFRSLFFCWFRFAVSLYPVHIGTGESLTNSDNGWTGCVEFSLRSIYIRDTPNNGNTKSSLDNEASRSISSSA